MFPSQPPDPPTAPQALNKFTAPTATPQRAKTTSTASASTDPMPGTDYRPPPQPEPVRKGRKGAFRNQQEDDYQERPQKKPNVPAGVDMSEADRLYRDSVRAELEKHRLLMEQIQRERANLNPVNLGPQAQKPSQQTRTEQQQAGRPAAKTKVSNNVNTK